MNRNVKTIITGIILSILSVSIGLAAPMMTQYQGRLTDATGGPAAPGTYAIDFALYTSLTGGSPLWSESFTSVSVGTDGLFSVLLGSSNPIPVSVATEPVLYLEITVNAEVQSPRTQLASVPYAMTVGTVHGATGGLIDGTLIIKPSTFDTLGNGIIVLDSNDNVAMTVTVDQSGNPFIDFYDPVDSKASAAHQKRISLRPEGLVMYGVTESDTTMSLTPDGNIHSSGQITLGQNSVSTGVWSTVFGFNNTATADSATISGGYNNLATGFNAVIGGGSFNEAGFTSTVSGGVANQALSQASTVGGGNVNIADGDVSVVAGGGQNSASGDWSAIGGGAVNSTSALYATIGGGGYNQVTDSSAVISGGFSNLVTFPFGTIPGGRDNAVNAIYSFAAGRNAIAAHAGSFVWSDSSSTNFFTSRADEFAIGAKNGLRVVANNASYGASFTNNGQGDGIQAYTNSNNGNGWGAVYAQSNGTAAAVSATNLGGGLAGYFNGNLTVTGSLSKGSGSFKIDHPLDPENKYLYHSFVESPDMKNIYDGNVVTDRSGYAVVELPDYFEALNSDFRYQLTVIGSFAQAIIDREISGNSFVIRTSEPNVKVSWMVTGIRQDAFAELNRIPVEEMKRPEDRGLYLHPEAFGFSKERGIGFINKTVIEEQQY